MLIFDIQVINLQYLVQDMDMLVELIIKLFEKYDISRFVK